MPQARSRMREVPEAGEVPVLSELQTTENKGGVNMAYYDRWSDRNRGAKRQGERDAERGYRSHEYDYESYTEHRYAYEDGYYEKQREIERREEERCEEERREERYRQERAYEEERYRQAQEEEYYRQQEEERPEQD